MPNVELDQITGKKVTIGTLLALVLGSGGYISVAGNPLYDILDDRYVTIAAQNIKLQLNIEDELAQIQRHIDNGTVTNDELIRKAVLEERLKRLEVKK